MGVFSTGVLGVLKRASSNHRFNLECQTSTKPRCLGGFPPRSTSHLPIICYKRGTPGIQQAIENGPVEIVFLSP